MPLADVQAQVKQAVVSGDAPGRLRIHARHYEASLVRGPVDRFPATVWLTGSAFVTAAAREFIRREPPARPCLAEYGGAFPSFLAARPQASALPYLADVARLEWLVGEVAVEVEHPAVPIDALSALEAADLPRTTLGLQPGVRYLAASWAVDALLGVYIADAAPERFEIAEETARIEVRGARGDVRFTRLTAGDFAFRRALAAGRPLEHAVDAGAAADGHFDPGPALAEIFTSGLVRSLT